jgi:Ala-tRNA(Pro) deacylase
MHIVEYLQNLGIPYQRFDHVAVFTVEESSTLPPMPGADTKNLFLQEEKGSKYFLVTVPHTKRTDLKKLAEVLGVKRLVFGSPEKLKEYLGVEPGSVTVLGLMHDTHHAVEFWIDEEVWNADEIQCHPLINTATLVIPRAGMQKFLDATGHGVHVASIPARL